jgi:hypothetical protein
MPLKAGTKKIGPIGHENQYAGSMAAAMEHAFMEEWPIIMGSDAPAPNDHMRLLFIAVAQGVVRHLKSNENSITVNVPSGGGGDFDADILTEGPLY